MMMMASHETDAGESETIAVSVPIRTVVRTGISRIIYINPRFGWTAAHIAHNFPVGRTPGQPDRVERHSGANLSLAYHRLIPARKTLVNFRIFRNARLGSGTTCKN